jgi:hypothetical protein
MVGSLGDGPGGNVAIDVLPPPPPPPPPIDIEVSIDPTGTVNPKTGIVTVSGTVECSTPSPVDISGDVTQRAGRVTIQGFFGGVIFCAGGEEPTPWSFTLEG